MIVTRNYEKTDSWSSWGLCGSFLPSGARLLLSGLLFRERLLCALILSVVRRLLRLSWLRVFQLLPELVRLRLGRVLPALVQASVLWRVLWPIARVGRTPLGRWWLEHAQQMAAHESPRTTKLYDRTKDEITIGEVERIQL